MTYDFHIYNQSGQLSITMDEADPQRADVMQAIADVMNKAGRAREADECLHAKTPVE